MAKNLWTRQELILAIRLYCELPFGKMHKGNPEVIKLSRLVNRSPSAVARKLGNFASFDPSLQERGVGGLPHTGKLDKEVWDQFYNDWESTVFESALIQAQLENRSLEEAYEIPDGEMFRKGLDRERVVRARVNQSFFRSSILASYNSTCCITGIDNPSVLIASHIAPWAKDKQNRLNPRNGLCLNALHDRAFDQGLITVTPDFTVVVSKVLRRSNNAAIKDYFVAIHNAKIALPNKFLPDRTLLSEHNARHKEHY